MRHCRVEKPRRWHIDYLRPWALMIDVWFSRDTERREHFWVALLAQDRMLMTPLQGFGSGDCRCRSHLFYSKLRPGIGRFRSGIQGQFPDHDPVFRWPAKDAFLPEPEPEALP
jgi:Uri superfamily endonuclease